MTLESLRQNYPLLVLQTRQSLALTQDEFAQVIGVHVMKISNWERGVRNRPSDHQLLLLQRLAQVRSPAIRRRLRSDGPIDALITALTGRDG